MNPSTATQRRSVQFHRLTGRRGGFWVMGIILAAASPSFSAPPDEASQEPTLDELLGLPKQSPSQTQDKSSVDRTQSSGSAANSELDRKLAPQEVSEQFEIAVGLMDDVAGRIAGAGDVGLVTQRIQEDILKKLDKLIDDAQKRQGKSSKSKQQQQQQQQDQQQQGRQSSQQQNQQRAGDSPQAGQAPPRRDGQPGTLRTGGSATWGNLPEHVRKALQQGLDDHFSSVYRAKTQEYYKRLAEEKKTGGEQRR